MAVYLRKPTTIEGVAYGADARIDHCCPADNVASLVRIRRAYVAPATDSAAVGRRSPEPATTDPASDDVVTDEAPAVNEPAAAVETEQAPAPEIVDEPTDALDDDAEDAEFERVDEDFETVASGWHFDKSSDPAGDDDESDRGVPMDELSDDDADRGVTMDEADADEPAAAPGSDAESGDPADGTPIDTLKIADGYIEKLQAAGITTVEMAREKAAIEGYSFADAIHGLGPAAERKIRAAL